MAAARKNGIETHQRLLETACELFAERGYQDTTIAEISAGAQANIAAVNYHFGDKEHLYREAWKYAFERGLRLRPADGGVPEDAPPQERLQGRIHALLCRVFDDRGAAGSPLRFMQHEMARPSGLLEEVREQLIAPLREAMHSILRQLLGNHVPDEVMHTCCVSIISQCIALGSHQPLRHALGTHEFGESEIRQLAEHITRFSLGGLQAVSAYWEQRQEAER